MIKQLPAPCWVVEDNSGGCHVDNQAEAQALADDMDVPLPERLSSGCWVAVCHCGNSVCSSGEYDVLHYAAESDAHDVDEANGGACSFHQPASCSPETGQ